MDRKKLAVHQYYSDKSKEAAIRLLHESQFGKSLEGSEKQVISILNGNRFMVSSLSGDITDEGQGVFRNDTRLLSMFKAKINGRELLTLTASNTAHYSAGFYLTNPELGSEGNDESDDDEWRATGKHDQAKVGERQRKNAIPRAGLAIHRMRFIEEDVREEYFITNRFEKPITISLSFELDSDFADIQEVKSRAFAELGSRDKQQSSSEVGGRARSWITKQFIQSENAFNFTYSSENAKVQAQTLVWFSKRAKRVTIEDTGGGSVRSRSNAIFFRVSLKPKEIYRLTIVIVLLTGGEKRRKKYSNEFFQEQEKKVEKALAHWALTPPTLETNWDELRHSYYQSIIDLISLRMSDPRKQYEWELPAAGCPWFMTIFGRDTLITAYQSMIFGSKLAIGAVDALSKLQGSEVNDRREEEPGKILHEMRYGSYASTSGMFPYYGTADATPLFLILISEIYRWTANKDFINKHRKNIMSALKWIDDHGDRDKDGFVEYIKRTKDGLDNQCWKDSWDSIRFLDGRLGRPPIATCEIQGYVYDAKTRMAEIAREVWKDKSLSKQLLDQARELSKIFNEKFWNEDKGYFALALDKDKRQVDSMTSNNGHLLWSGIVEEKKAGRVVEKLMSDEMFSGYGIRTLSTKSGGYNPIGYHTGCVWPHDNSLIAEGLARYGKKREATKIIDAMLEASHHFGYILPETFAGFQRLKMGFPVRYPTAASPQAWAAGAPLFFLRTLLGLNPSHERKEIRVNPILVDRETRIELSGLQAFGRSYCISVAGDSRSKKEIKEIPMQRR